LSIRRNSAVRRSRGKTINQLVQESEGDEQALYILLASSGMRISEALAIERENFTNDGCTILVRQQVHREKPLIVSYLKTDAAYRDIDLQPEVAEYLRVFICGEDGLLFKTRNGTPFFFNTHRRSGQYVSGCEIMELSRMGG
jgi:integrase